MRVLIGSDVPADLAAEIDDARLDELYDTDQVADGVAWLRVNMISTLDGAATGDDARSGGINNAADKRVFDTLRRWCEAVLVGAGTARAEGYAAQSVPIVVVSRRGEVPSSLRDAPVGAVLLATCAGAEHLDSARGLLGEDQVLVLGGHRVDLMSLKAGLAERGLTRVLAEGGPHLLRDLLEEGAVDELDLTWVPRVLAGDHPGITAGPPVDRDLGLALLLEDAGTLLGRWLVRR